MHGIFRTEFLAQIPEFLHIHYIFNFAFIGGVHNYNIFNRGQLVPNLQYFLQQYFVMNAYAAAFAVIGGEDNGFTRIIRINGVDGTTGRPSP
jgi:hypothetical protein